MTTLTESRPEPTLARQTAAFVELGKLRLSSLAIFTVLAGVYMGATREPGWPLLIGTTVGTLLIAVGGNAFNMLIERETDGYMHRTRGRPLPTGRLSPAQVAAFGATVTLTGLGILATTTNLLATLLCATIFATYVGVYTPLKRRTTLNTLIGAVPGALPPVVGYAASRGRIDNDALLLFGILFLWQIPHFLAIAWRHREDYARGGMKMLPVVDPDGRATARHMIVYTLALSVLVLVPYGTRMAGEAYLGTALCLNLLFLVPVGVAAVLRSETAMRQAFLVSIFYLPVLLGVMVLDRW